MKLLSTLLLLFTCIPLATAADQVRTATVVSVNGTVSLSGPDGKSIAAAPGAQLPEGSMIETSDGGQVSVRFFDGTVSIVQPTSTVTIESHRFVDAASGPKENTLLDLKAGGVITSLDPAKKKISDFRVRTPKGVAAARGTVFAVRVSQNRVDSTVTTMSGTVTFITDQGEISVPFGQVSNGGAAQTVSDAVKSNPNLAQEILQATSAVAAAVGSGTVANTDQTPNLTTAVLAALIDVAVQAAPANAAETVRQVLAAAGPALSGGQAAAIAQAAIQAAGDNPGVAAAIQQAVADVAPAAAAGENTNPILPPLDQTQIIVSPSRP